VKLRTSSSSVAEASTALLKAREKDGSLLEASSAYTIRSIIKARWDDARIKETDSYKK
jgi:hypothetical protein